MTKKTFKPTEATSAILNSLVALIDTGASANKQMTLIHMRACEAQDSPISQADIEKTISRPYPKGQASDVNILVRDILSDTGHCEFSFADFTREEKPLTISTAVTSIRDLRKAASDAKATAKKTAQWEQDAAKAFIESDQEQVAGAVNETILQAMAQAEVPVAVEAIELGKLMVSNPFDELTSNQKTLNNALKAIESIISEGTQPERDSLELFAVTYDKICADYAASLETVTETPIAASA